MFQALISNTVTAAGKILGTGQDWVRFEEVLISGVSDVVFLSHWQY